MTVIQGDQGGTGVNNSSKTITLAANLVTSGANNLTLTTTGVTNVTLPTTGTLITSGGSPSFATLTATNTTNQIALGTTRTLTVSAPTPATTSRTGTIPDVGANFVFAQATAGNNCFLTTTGATNVTLPTSGILISGTPTAFVKYVASDGSDVSGTGSAIWPFQTPAHAQALITDQESSVPYVINCTGNAFSGTNYTFKPWISYQGNGIGNTYFTIAGSASISLTENDSGIFDVSGMTLSASSGFNFNTYVASPAALTLTFTDVKFVGPSFTMVGRAGFAWDKIVFNNCDFSAVTSATFSAVSVVANNTNFGTCLVTCDNYQAAPVDGTYTVKINDSIINADWVANLYNNGQGPDTVNIVFTVLNTPWIGNFTPTINSGVGLLPLNTDAISYPTTLATEQIRYVSSKGSDTTGNGSIERPFATYSHTASLVASGATVDNQFTIVIMDTISEGGNILYYPFVNILGYGAYSNITTAGAIQISGTWDNGNRTMSRTNCTITALSGVFVDFTGFDASYYNIITEDNAPTYTGGANLIYTGRDTGGTADILRITNNLNMSGNYLLHGMVPQFIGNTGISSDQPDLAADDNSYTTITGNAVIYNCTQFDNISFTGTVAALTVTVYGSPAGQYTFDTNVTAGLDIISYINPTAINGATVSLLTNATGLYVPYSPVNYPITGANANKYFQGIDTALGQVQTNVLESNIIANWDASRTPVGLVSSWTDFSGNAKTATATSTDRPTCVANLVNGKNALVFNGSNNLTADFTAEVSIATDFTIMAVFQNTSGSNGNIISSNVSTTDRMVIDIESSKLISAIYDGVYTPSSTAFTNTSQPHVVTMTNSGGVVAQYLDNVASASTDNPTTSAGVSEFLIGNNIAGTGLNGFICQIIVWDVKLTTNQITQQYNLLAAEWGVGASVLRVVTAAGAVTVANTDYIVEVNKASGAATTVNLPAGVFGKQLIIKDGKGDAATNNITLTPAAGNIDGSSTYVMNVNYQSVSLAYDGAKWIIT